MEPVRRKPGRPRKRPVTQALVPTTAYLPPPLKQLVSDAADASERNLSEEIQHRLHASFGSPNFDDRPDLAAITTYLEPVVKGLLSMAAQMAGRRLWRRKSSIGCDFQSVIPRVTRCSPNWVAPTKRLGVI